MSAELKEALADLEFAHLRPVLGGWLKSEQGRIVVEAARRVAEADEVWVECPTCEGLGFVDTGDIIPDSDPCPDCVDGLVPSDGEIEAAQRQIRHYLEEELFLGLVGIVDYEWLARAALVAARRYQRKAEKQ